MADPPRTPLAGQPGVLRRLLVVGAIGGALALLPGPALAALCTGGGLSLTAPATVSLPAASLNGLDTSVSAQVAFTPDDETGTNAGWNITGTSTTFTDGSGHSLPITATTVTAGSAASTAGTCVAPVNAVTYPVTLPAGTTAPTAAKLFDAAVATGTGPSTVTLTVKLAVPARTYAGSYSSTWTFTIGVGP